MLLELFTALGANTIVPLPLLALLLIVICYLAQYFKAEPANLPPGPRTWPIVGNLAMLDFKRPHESMTKWAKMFGPIYRLYFGKEIVVVLNDFESIKEAFCGKHGEVLSGRPNLFLMNEFGGGGRHGIACSDGEQWKEQRRFTISVLRDFGFGRPLMEQKIRLEVDKMMQQFQLLETVAFGASHGVDHVIPIKLCSANIICSLILGHSFSPGDPSFIEYQRRVAEFMRLALNAQTLNYFPILQYLVPGGMGIGMIREHLSYIRKKFLRPKIAEHLAKLKPEDTMDQATDLTSAYLIKMKEMELQAENIQREKRQQHWFNLTELESIINDLFIAGHETTVTTINWTILYLLHYPNVLKKLQAEIDEQIGGLPTWEDRSRLPYTMATIAEVQRLSNILPLGVFHSALEEVQLRDWTLPKGTILMSNLFACHMDERFFPNPRAFRPERYLDADSGSMLKTEGLIPFAMGKRACLGESLARMELFLIVTTLFYTYEFKVPDSVVLPALQPIFGATLTPPNYKIKLIRRQKS